MRRTAPVSREHNGPTTLELLAMVALLEDLPSAGLQRGEVGTIVEVINSGTCLVEFSDHHGVPYAIEALPAPHLLRLHHGPTKQPD